MRPVPDNADMRGSWLRARTAVAALVLAVRLACAPHHAPRTSFGREGND